LPSLAIDRAAEQVIHADLPGRILFGLAVR
jgi:hypothetical protein